MPGALDGMALLPGCRHAAVKGTRQVVTRLLFIGSIILTGEQ
jgi:hypothetical protein